MFKIDKLPDDVIYYKIIPYLLGYTFEDEKAIDLFLTSKRIYDKYLRYYTMLYKRYFVKNNYDMHKLRKIDNIILSEEFQAYNSIMFDIKSVLITTDDIINMNGRLSDGDKYDEFCTKHNYNPEDVEDYGSYKNYYNEEWDQLMYDTHILTDLLYAFILDTDKKVKLHSIYIKGYGNHNFYAYEKINLFIVDKDYKMVVMETFSGIGKKYEIYDDRGMEYRDYELDELYFKEFVFTDIKQIEKYRTIAQIAADKYFIDTGKLSMVSLK